MTTQLSAVCEAIVDCEHKTAPVTHGGGYYAVGTPAMRGNRISYAEAREIDRATFISWTRRLSPAGGDLLLAREAPVGPVVMMPAEGRVAPGQRTVLLRPMSGRVVPRFLYYLLVSPRVQSALQEGAAGSTVPHLNVSDVRKLSIPDLPALSMQRAIAEILGALDDKIAANEIKSQRCVDLGDLKFRLASGALEVHSLASVATIVLGGTPSRKVEEYWRDGTVPWIGSGALNHDIVMRPATYISEVALEASAAKMMPVGATGLAITGATLGQVAYLGIATSGNQSVVGIWGGSPEENAWLYYAVRNAVPYILSHATGAAQQHVNKANVASTLIPWDEMKVRHLGGELSTLLGLAVASQKESIKLIELRDTLLPALMSGRIRVKDAEKTVSEVV